MFSNINNYFELAVSRMIDGISIGGMIVTKPIPVFIPRKRGTC